MKQNKITPKNLYKNDSKLYIKNTKYGRGVFAKKVFKKNEIIHIAPLIVIHSSESGMIERTQLKNYVFWHPDGICLALGLGSLFNHSDSDNVDYELNEDNTCLIFKTRKYIKRNQQLFIDYGYEPTMGVDID